MAERVQLAFGERVADYIAKNGGPRVVLGLFAIILVQFLLVLNWAAAKTAEREVVFLALKADVERMQVLSEREGIEDIRTTVEERLATYRARTFKANTAGLAAAQIRTALQSSVDAASLERVQMTVNIEDDEIDDVVVFMIDINARENENGDFSIFIADLARHAEMFGISFIDYSIRARQLNLTLETVAEIVEDP